MRISLVLLLCLVIVVVNSFTTKTTRRRAVVIAGRNTTKAPVPKSAYAYLRTIRGKNSCASGSCPFWERHGRSFASLRCYSKQYQECTCLHRMCFSSCMFTPQICNQEMVSCLRQICPLCMPTSASAMCAIYDSMAERVAQALSVFACYPCCPNINGASTNSSNAVPTTVTTTPVWPGSSSTVPSGQTEDIAVDPSVTENSAGGEYYPGNEYQTGTDPLPASNQNGQYYPTNNVNGGAFTNGNTNGITNGINNGYSNGNGNGYTNSNGNGISSGISNGYSNGINNAYSNTNGNGINNAYSNTNGNGISNAYSNTNGNYISNGYSNGNGIINGNGNSYTSGNGNSNPNGNGYTNGNGNSNQNGNGNSNPNGNGNGYSNTNSNTNSNGNGNNVASGNGNGISNSNSNGNGNGNGNSGNCNLNNPYPGVVFPGSDAIFYNNNFPSRQQQVIKQRARQTARTTKRRLATTRGTPLTTRRMVQAIVTVRGNNVKSGIRKPVQTQKKPQTNNRVQS